jgi:predicted nucleic acid-binding protein
VIVLDASAILEVLLATPSAAAVLSRLSAPGETLHAPHLLDLEVLLVLRRYAANGEITVERAHQAVEDYLDFPILRYAHEVLALRIWQLRDKVTAYDGAYIALAEALAAPVVTRDQRMAAARGHRATIELL